MSTKNGDVEFALLETLVRIEPPLETWKCLGTFQDFFEVDEPELRDAWKRLVARMREWNSAGRPIGAIRRRLPEERASITEHFHVGPLEGYFIVGLFPDGRPGELFIKIAKEGSTLAGLTDAFAISVSMNLQYGVPLSKLVGKFKGTRFEPEGYTGREDVNHASSLLDYIFQRLELRFLGGPGKEDGNAKQSVP